MLTLLSTAAGSAVALAIGGCAQEQAEDWERPDWFRSKRGTNGNGRGRG